MTAIPKRLGHIWIGPKPAPVNWMNTWPEKHPDWEYTVYDNDFLTGFPFRLRKQINEYFWRGLYAGVQDMMRYEILYRFGGFMADADAICLHPVDELLDQKRAYTVYDRPETDKFRGVCPILACEPGNPFVGKIIETLASVPPEALRKAEVSTGNRFLMSKIREWQPNEDDLKIWPTHYFVPWQKSDPDAYYDGPDKVYAEQKWATSMYSYNREDGPSDVTFSAAEVESNRNRVLEQLAGGSRRPLSPLRDLDEPKLDDVGRYADRVKAVLASDDGKADLARLNTAVVASLKASGFKNQPVHGLHFYRHMQNTSLIGSKLRTRSDAIRARLLGWLAQAKDALVIGYDAGHLPLVAMHLNPDLRICAIDSGKWRRDKDRNPPATQVYVPAAANWLNARFPEAVSASVGMEAEHLTNMSQDAANHRRFDLLLMPASDVTSLSVLKAALPLLKEDAVVVTASAQHLTGATQATRFLMQDLACCPIEQHDYGTHNGSMSAFRPIAVR
ncbi:glycosyltransferase family 32 protein [Yoonia litorea]|uniref:Glycosyltransferase sugar-binding region containing DXD motif-containing protein n=1 Tax=Yoonia litorea TaxID=1123755 RepID=A0A1I6MV96_9RHOB|nr:glycosyltransferase [Yoonia litorea]SFS19547.1 Glycosyltransferase sugar-binding region containing DXD motif-containing protein [Yoonia litorea]